MLHDPDNVVNPAPSSSLRRFEEFFEKFWGALVRYFLRHVPEEVAEELAAQTCVQTYQAYERADGDLNSLEAMAWKIARDQKVSYFREKARLKELRTKLEDETRKAQHQLPMRPIEDDLISEEAFEHLVSQLSARDRYIAVLYFGLDYRPREIAEELAFLGIANVTAKTVSNRLSQIKQQLVQLHQPKGTRG